MLSDVQVFRLAELCALVQENYQVPLSRLHFAIFDIVRSRSHVSSFFFSFLLMSVFGL